MRDRLEDALELTRLSHMLGHKEPERSGKAGNTLLWVLAIIGAVAAVALIAYAVYHFMTPSYTDDLDEDDFFDDFDDDFEEDIEA